MHQEGGTPFSKIWLRLITNGVSKMEAASKMKSALMPSTPAALFRFSLFSAASTSSCVMSAFRGSEVGEGEAGWGSRHGEGALRLDWAQRGCFRNDLLSRMRFPYRASGRTPSMLPGRCCCAVPAFPCTISRMFVDPCPQACTNPVQPSFGVLLAFGG